MSGKTSIEWTDATWNPVRGCSRVSEGCRNCYAERVAARFSGPGMAYEGLAKMVTIGKGTPQERTEPHWTGKIALIEDEFDRPLRWKRPRKVFVNSMSDLFHEGVSDAALVMLFTVMANAKEHTFQILTKRPERMLEFMKRLKWQVGLALTRFSGRTHMFARMAYVDNKDWVSIADKENRGLPAKQLEGWVAPNIWLGVSVENQKAADERIPLLLETPAAVRFLSIEPLLGPVDLDKWIGYCDLIETDGKSCASCIAEQQIHWVIVGGESGRGARPMHPDWAGLLRDQCDYAGIPFFFKQWGEWLPAGQSPEDFDPATLPKADDRYHQWSADESSVHIGKKAAGRKLDGVEHSAFPAVSL